MKFIYKGFTYIYAMPIAILVLLMRLFGNHSHATRLGIGIPKPASADNLIWFVASSVGEVAIGIKLIEKIKSESGATVLLTVTTKTGKQYARQQNCKADIICYHPLDLPIFVRRFLRVIQPKKIVLIETELWPSLLEEALAAKIKVIQVSGRISAKSLRRYLPFRPLFQPLLQQCDKFMMQSAEDAERLSQLIGRDDQIVTVGTLKGEYTPPDQQSLKAFGNLLSKWSDAIVITCGSIRPGEGAILSEAISTLVGKLPKLRFILAPRHLDKSADLESQLTSLHLNWKKRSDGEIDRDTRVVLLDTMGELNLAYHCSKIAFVGGTLVPIGGHNLLEPALAGCPVIYGPHCENQIASRDLLEQLQLGHTVHNVTEFISTVESLIQSLGDQSKIAGAVEQLRGANVDLMDTYVKEVLR